MSRRRPNRLRHVSSHADNTLSRLQVVVCLASFCLLVLLAGCSTPSLRSIALNPPGPQTIPAGQTLQYQALGSYIQGTHPASTSDITATATWSSSNATVATVSAGLVAAFSAGTTTITVSAEGQSGIVTATADITVTGSGTTGNTLTAITILPASQPVLNIGETSQFIAIGSYSGTPATQDLTNIVTWGSSDVFVATINPSGLATTISAGSTTITALYTQPTMTTIKNPTISATATLTSASSTGTVTLPTLTVYKVGATASSAIVTASYTSPTGAVLTPINCSAGASAALCTGNFPVGVTVTLTTPDNGSTPAFGGWSSNCTPVPGNPYACTVTLTVPPGQTGVIGNVNVGAIFD